MDGYANRSASLLGDIGQRGADGMGKGDVRHQLFVEECGSPPASAVEELVGQHEVQRLEFLAERADGAEREDILDTELFESVDVGAKIEIGGHDAVAAAMPGQEGHFPSGDAPNHVRVGRCSPRRVDPHLFAILERVHGVEAAAPDNSDPWVHELTIVMDGFRASGCHSGRVGGEPVRQFARAAIYWDC